MVKEFGKEARVEAINFKGNGKMIKNKDMVFLLGEKATYTKEIM